MTETINGRIRKIGIGEAEFKYDAPDNQLEFHPGLLGRDYLIIVQADRTRIRLAGSPKEIAAIRRGLGDC